MDWSVRVMVFNTNLNNISVISCRSVLLVEKIGVPGENYLPASSQWPTLSHILYRVHLAMSVGGLGVFLHKLNLSNKHLSVMLANSLIDSLLLNVQEQISNAYLGRKQVQQYKWYRNRRGAEEDNCEW